MKNLTIPALDNRTGTVLAAGVLFLLTGYVYQKLTSKKRRYPPGPRTWPIVGNLFDFIGVGDISTVFAKYRKKFGDVFTVHIGSTRIVILNGASAVQEALVTRGSDFAGRFAPYSVKLIAPDTEIMSRDFQPLLQAQRKVMHNALRNLTADKHLERAVQEAATNVAKYARKKQEGGLIDPMSMMTYVIFNLVHNTTFGKTFEIDDPDFLQAVETGDFLHCVIFNGLVADYFPLLSFYPTRTIMMARKKYLPLQMQFFGRLWQECAAKYDPSNVSSFSDYLLKMRDEIKEKGDNEILMQLHEGHYASNAISAFSAGSETTKNALVWLILYMAVNPDIQRKVQKEVDAVIGKREVRISDRPNLPYCEAIVYEIMRIKPFSLVLAHHKTTRDTSAGGLNIPANTNVMLNVMSVHMDPETYPEPDKFRPERFLDENGKFVPRPGKWLPFSAGRRICAGQVLARVELPLLVAGLFQKCSFFPADDQEVDFRRQDVTFVNIPRHQKVKVKLRN